MSRLIRMWRSSLYGEIAQQDQSGQADDRFDAEKEGGSMIFHRRNQSRGAVSAPAGTLSFSTSFHTAPGAFSLGFTGPP